MRDILDSRVAREHGIIRREYIDMLMSAPEMHPRIQGSKLWHIAVLAMKLATASADVE
ncbi:MAG: hypothetical protein ABFS39_06830 [Pseudomonadota bacterium]